MPLTLHRANIIRYAARNAIATADFQPGLNGSVAEVIAYIFMVCMHAFMSCMRSCHMK